MGKNTSAKHFYDDEDQADYCDGCDDEYLSDGIESYLKSQKETKDARQHQARASEEKKNVKPPQSAIQKLTLQPGKPSDNDWKTFLKSRASLYSFGDDAHDADDDDFIIPIYLMMAGHVDAGKSTLMAHFLKLLDSSSGHHKHAPQLAWKLDDMKEEQERGITMDLAMRRIRTSRQFGVFIDVPGHHDFVPAMIQACHVAQVCLFVVDATVGEFEKGCKAQTLEHLFILKHFSSISHLIIVANKMDKVGWNENRFIEIKEEMRKLLVEKVQWENIVFEGKPHTDGGLTMVQFVAVSGLLGSNLVTSDEARSSMSKSENEPMSNSLLQAIDGISLYGNKKLLIENLLREPFQLSIFQYGLSEIKRNQKGTEQSSSSVIVEGMVSSGFLSLQNGKSKNVLVMPSGQKALIKGVEFKKRDYEASTSIKHAFPFDYITIILDEIDSSFVKIGSVIVGSPARGKALDLSAQSFDKCSFLCEISVFGNDTLILPGSSFIMHCRSSCVPIVVSHLKVLTTGEKSEAPRFLKSGNKALIQIDTLGPFYCEKDLKVLLRQHGLSAASGTIVRQV